MSLRIHQLSKTFYSTDAPVKALDSISLEIKPGELVTVNGRSGCGKTTLLLSAGGLLLPDHGEVTIDEHILYALSTEDRARMRAGKIGFVFQQFHLLPYLDVINNVMLAALAGTESLARAKELLKRFNLAERLHHKPGSLSTGERQRVALVRALINNPLYLLADEPTGNLDDDNAAEVMAYIVEFATDGGGVLLVSHDPRTGDSAGTRYTMNKGRFV